MRSVAGEIAPREFRLPAEASRLHEARNHVENAACEFGLRDTARFQFVLAVNEAVTNAIRHGDPDRQGNIALRIESVGDALVCQVKDSGQFRFSAPRTDPLPSHGRGLALMRLLADDVELDAGPHGTSVRLWKQRASSEGEPR